MLRYSGSACSSAVADWIPQRGDGSSADHARLDSRQFRDKGAGESGRHDDRNPGPLAAKIRNFVDLDDHDVATLEGLCRNGRTVEPEHVIVEEGSHPGSVCIILAGLAYRYKLLPGGHRQILGYLIPGDLCDLSFTIVDRADHSVAAVVETRIAKIPVRRFIEALATSANVTLGLHLSAHLDAVIMREWLLNVGQRKAHQRLSHFLCEMAVRLRMVGEMKDDGSFDFPLSQSMLADTVGLTPVHINRTLQRLRAEGLIVLNRRRLTITDMQRLVAIGGFEGNYLKTFDFLT